MANVVTPAWLCNEAARIVSHVRPSADIGGVSLLIDGIQRAQATSKELWPNPAATMLAVHVPLSIFALNRADITHALKDAALAALVNTPDRERRCPCCGKAYAA